jgi:hypothetical protein
MPHSGIFTIDDPTLLSRQHEVNSIKDYGFSGRTGISSHGALADAWVMPRRSAAATLDALLARWQACGLPNYAEFDNEAVIQGPHQFTDTVGRVSRLCLALGVIPVFATAARTGIAKCHRRIQCPVAEQGLAAPPLSQYRSAPTRIGDLHRRTPHQNGAPP